ncbi:DNA phosphorothioation-dependent restriction protein DptF [Hymenobacter sp. BT186]|uniref:DNA phosphorothioation-dependent restriction protein DptF n=1 Tax=Hymenobacter telluris TaxID=2816474 RepID=A0A939F0H2_9BACT|nr:DNA phosphorothioation-dependent restriction protein DptF [Hymenobacter telluris]MBO0360885.1 DNA phosphorothioation-dependent restriction protein DptF [Hymenobacter telluris]MBW3376914.1 DNA phosphorothioation-dependent restriction protein DptF [Hymenobacter norwichensis]
MSLKSLLDTLRISSKDAIVNGDSATTGALKNYLHVKRSVEERLSSIISLGSAQSKPRLIFVIGNVGDGKSHLMSKMWEAHAAELGRYTLHNDATESNDINKTYIETLSEVLAPFNDAQLADTSNTSKTIVAINLGTLANFLAAKGDLFTILGEYIEKNNIMEEGGAVAEIESDYFSFINLADYHIFSLTKEGAKADILLELLEKITKPSKNNPFYNAYQETYAENQNLDNCPIKYNYDLISDKKVQESLSKLIIFILVKDKVIISIRQLLNWIYDILVAPRFANLPYDKVIDLLDDGTGKHQFHYDILPSLLFDNAGTSNILKLISKYDPIKEGNEELDKLITTLGKTRAPLKHFINEGLVQGHSQLSASIETVDVQERVKLFVRLNYLLQSNTDLIDKNESFTEYTRILFSYHSGDKAGLKPLYNNMMNAIYRWNGTTKDSGKSVNIGVGKDQTAYKITHELVLEFSPAVQSQNSTPSIYRFVKFAPISFKIKNDSTVFDTTVDYNLYKLAVDMNKGYRVNLVDKREHLDFSTFVDRISNHQSSTKDLTIQVYQGQIQETHTLKYDAGFDTFQFE